MPSWFAEIRFLLTIVGIGLFVIGLSHYTWKKFLLVYQRPWSLKNLAKGFKAKMWMTCGLGIIFFSFYGLLVIISAHYIKVETAQFLFAQAYQSPSVFIYAGMLTFACFSLMIYLVRMFIKYLFLTRGKGD